MRRYVRGQGMDGHYNSDDNGCLGGTQARDTYRRPIRNEPSGAATVVWPGRPQRAACSQAAPWASPPPRTPDSPVTPPSPASRCCPDAFSFCPYRLASTSVQLPEFKLWFALQGKGSARMFLSNQTASEGLTAIPTRAASGELRRRQSRCSDSLPVLSFSQSSGRWTKSLTSRQQFSCLDDLSKTFQRKTWGH